MKNKNRINSLKIFFIIFILVGSLILMSEGVRGGDSNNCVEGRKDCCKEEKNNQIIHSPCICKSRKWESIIEETIVVYNSHQSCLNSINKKISAEKALNKKSNARDIKTPIKKCEDAKKIRGGIDSNNCELNINDNKRTGNICECKSYNNGVYWQCSEQSDGCKKEDDLFAIAIEELTLEQQCAKLKNTGLNIDSNNCEININTMKKTGNICECDYIDKKKKEGEKEGEKDGEKDGVSFTCNPDITGKCKKDEQTQPASTSIQKECEDACVKNPNFADNIEGSSGTKAFLIFIKGKEILPLVNAECGYLSDEKENSSYEIGYLIGKMLSGKMK